MILTPEEAREVIWDDHEDWVNEEGPHLEESRRWSLIYTGIFLHKSTNKYYQFCWSVGATEQQDEQPFQYEKEVKVIEVHKLLVQKEEWLPVTIKQSHAL